MPKTCHDISHGRARWQRIKVSGNAGIVGVTLFAPFLFCDGVDGGHTLGRRFECHPTLEGLELHAASFEAKENAHVS